MTNHLTSAPPVPQVYQSPHTHSSIHTAGRCSMPARLTPAWRLIVQIEMGGRSVLALPEASIARHAIEACGRFRGAYGALLRRCAHHGTARRRRTTPQGQLNTPVHWARWTVRQQLTLRRHQARPKLRLGSLCVVSCSERARARNGHSHCPWYWSTPTSKSQEFGRNSAAFSLEMSARATPASVCRE
jgi:hypothetical protein